MRDDSANQLSARTPEAKSLSGDILAVTAYGSGFCPAPAYPTDGKPLRTKILEGCIKKNQPSSHVSASTNLGLLGGWRRYDLARSAKAWRKSADVFL